MKVARRFRPSRRGGTASYTPLLWQQTRAIIVYSAILRLVWPAAIVAQERCGCKPDPQVITLPNDPNAYRDRGNRCEGLALMQVAGRALRMVSLTESVESFNLSTRTPLRVDWSAPPGASGPVRVHAEVLRSRSSYRMDTQCEVSTTSFSWPTHVLAELRVSPAAIGMLASVTRNVGKYGAREIFLPVRVGQLNRPQVSAEYRLTIISQLELAEVFVRTVRLDVDGGPLEPRQELKPLGRRYYPPGLPIEIRLAKPRSEGLVAVELGAQGRSGLASTLELLIFHNARSSNGDR